MYETMTEAFEDHFRHSDEPFEAWKTRLLGHADFDPDLWWLAWDGEKRPAGLIAYDHGDLGWIQGLGVRRPWRRRGLGAALLAHALAAFAARGQLRVDLGVDAEGETRPLRLYERAGMQAGSAYELYARRLVRLRPRGATPGAPRQPLAAPDGRPLRRGAAPPARRPLSRSRSSSSMSALVRGENPARLRRSHHSSSGSRLSCAQRT